jgi:hypothetical protein
MWGDRLHFTLATCQQQTVRSPCSLILKGLASNWYTSIPYLYLVHAIGDFVHSSDGTKFELFYSFLSIALDTSSRGNLAVGSICGRTVPPGMKLGTHQRTQAHV